MTQAFVATNIILAVLIAVWMKITTPHGSIHAAFHDPDARWDMLRRVFYVSIATGCFGMAAWVAEGWIDPRPAECVFWLMVTVPIAAFLGLRAGRIINQDRWIGFRQIFRSAERDRDLRDVARDCRDLAVDIEDPCRRHRALCLAAQLDQAIRNS